MGESKSDTSTKAEGSLRILATSDVHMHLSGWDARSGETDTQKGMDRLAASIAHARASAPGLTVLFDNGDALQGTPIADQCAQSNDLGDHPWSIVVNALGYDALGLGNHDFDYGLDVLEAVVEQINAPVLCASLAEGHINGIFPYMVLRRLLCCTDGVTRPLLIGVASVLPHQTMIWNSRNLADQISLRNGVDAAQRAVAALKKQGVDIVVMLCHSGLSKSPDPDAENFATALAVSVQKIDALILGHTHQTFPSQDHDAGAWADTNAGTLNGVPAVMPGHEARFLGSIDLQLAWQDGVWSITGHNVALYRSKDNDPVAAVTDIAAPAIAATAAELEKELTTTEHGFHSYFEMLQTGTGGALVADAMKRVVADYVSGTKFAELPLLASVAPFSVGGQGGIGNYLNVPKGKILERHVATICPFSNWIWAAVLQGSDLWDWAERAAAYFAPIRGKASLLVDPAAPSFTFDSLYGLETTIDPFVAPRFSSTKNLKGGALGRIRALTWDGITVDPEVKFLVAVTSYRGAGGGAFPGLNNSDAIMQTDAKVCDSLRAHLKKSPLGPSPAKSVWRFSPGLGEEVIIETSPSAAEHLEEIARFNPKPAGISDDGFLRVKVSL